MRSLQHCTCSARLAAGPPNTTGGNSNQNPNKRLNAHLQRLKAATTNPSATETLNTSIITTAPTTTSSPVRSDESFLTTEELATLSKTQQAFVVRKRKYALGMGPLFSADSMCTTCEGTGVVCCHQCQGTGFNAEEKQGMFDNEKGVRILNGLVNISYFFMENGPCWLCTTKKVIGCAECSGSGIKGGLEGFIGD